MHVMLHMLLLAVLLLLLLGLADCAAGPDDRSVNFVNGMRQGCCSRAPEHAEQDFLVLFHNLHAATAAAG